MQQRTTEMSDMQQRTADMSDMQQRTAEMSDGTSCSLRASAKGVKTFSLEEVAKHNSRDDCWLIIDNKVYNVTSWIPLHPGGEHLILSMGGKDCTEEFRIFHFEPNYKRLKTYFIGELAPEQRVVKTELSEDIAKIVQELKERGAFKSDPWLYLFCGSIVVLLAISAGYCLRRTDSYAWVALGAVCMGLFWQQLAFIGHDLGHHVVTHSYSMDNTISYFVGNLIQGISLEWWKHNHNTHHVLTNSMDHDPDIQHLPFMAVSPTFFRSIYSKYYKRVMTFDAAGKFFVPYQHWWFYVVMSLARFNLYAQSFIFNLIGPGSKSPRQRNELITLFGFWVWMTALLYSLGSFSNIMLFLLLSHAVAGLVHVQITINHFSMKPYVGVPQHSYKEDGYIRSQLTTTTNIDCPAWLDWLHGGLQFQIEHHLFPHTTRSHFRFVRERVKELCLKHGLTYHSKSFWRANYDVLKCLKETAQHAEISDYFWEGINAVG